MENQEENVDIEIEVEEAGPEPSEVSVETALIRKTISLKKRRRQHKSVLTVLQKKCAKQSVVNKKRYVMRKGSKRINRVKSTYAKFRH